MYVCNVYIAFCLKSKTKLCPITNILQSVAVLQTTNHSEIQHICVCVTHKIPFKLNIVRNILPQI